MDSFEMKGIWWSPEKEDIKIRGILHFNPSEGGTLELLDAFCYEAKLLFNGVLLIKDIILGLVDDDKITCYKCSRINYRESETIRTENYAVSYIFKGYHFLKEEDILFDRISLKFSPLEDWLSGLPPFYEERLIQDVCGKTTFSLNCVLQNNAVELYKSPEFVLSLISNFNLKWGTNPVVLEQNTFFKIVFKNPTHFNYWMNDVLSDLRNLLSLALNTPVSPVLIRGINKNHKRFHPYTKKEVYPEIIIFSKINSSVKKVNISNILFTYNDFKEKTNLYFNNWFQISKDLKPMIDLYLGNLYNSEMFLEFKFLSLAQAIEFYHRKRFNGNYLEPQKFHEIHFVLSETVRNYTDENTTTFINKLRYLNQYTLKKRIKEILIFLNKRDLLKWNSDKRNSFARDVGDYRDILTHYENNDYTTLDYNLLLSRIDEMEMVLKKCFLYEIYKEK